MLQDEDKALTCRNAEQGLCRVIMDLKRNRRMQNNSVRSDGRDEAVFRRLGPRQHGPVIEPQAQIHA